MISNRRTVNSGFTLIELIVSLMIMSILSAAVLSGLRSGLIVWNKGTSHIEDLRRTRLVSQLLNDSIRGALPLMYTVKDDQGTRSLLAFDGARDHLTFVSRNSFRDGPNTVPRWIDIRWIQSPQQRYGELVVEERTMLPPTNVPSPNVYWRSPVLQAEHCSFDFLKTPGDEAPSWIQDWVLPLSARMPKAVRINCLAQAKKTVSIVPVDYALSQAAGLKLN